MFNTTLRVRNAKIFYKWTRKGPFGFTQRGTFWMKADVIDFYIEIIFNTTEKKNVTYSVASTLFAKPEDVTMEFKGLGILDYGVNFGIKTMYKLFKGKLDKAIESLVNLIVKQKVDVVVQSHNNPRL